MSYKFERPAVTIIGIWEDKLLLRIAEGPLSLAGRPTAWQVVTTAMQPSFLPRHSGDSTTAPALEAASSASGTRTINVERSSPTVDVELAELPVAAQLRVSVRGVGVGVGGKALVSDAVTVDQELLPKLCLEQPYLYHDHASVLFSFPGWPCPAMARIAAGYEMRIGRTRNGPWTVVPLSVSAATPSLSSSSLSFLRSGADGGFVASCSHLSGFARLTFSGDDNPLDLLEAFQASGGRTTTTAAASTLTSRQYYAQIRCVSHVWAVWSSWSELQHVFLQPKIVARAAAVMTSTMVLEYGFSRRLTQPVATEDGGHAAAAAARQADADTSNDAQLPISDIEILTWPALRENYSTTAEAALGMQLARLHFKVHRTASTTHTLLKPFNAVTLHGLLPGTVYNLKLRWKYHAGSGVGSGWHQRLVRFATRALPRIARIPQISTTGFEVTWMGGKSEMNVQTHDLSLFSSVEPTADAAGLVAGVTNGGGDRPALEESMLNFSYVLPSDLHAYPNPVFFVVKITSSSAREAAGMATRNVQVPFDAQLAEHLCQLEGLEPAVAYCVSVRFVHQQSAIVDGTAPPPAAAAAATAATTTSAGSTTQLMLVDPSGRIVAETQSDASDTVVVTTCASIHLAVEQRGTSGLWVSYQAPRPPPVLVIVPASATGTGGGAGVASRPPFPGSPVKKGSLMDVVRGTVDLAHTQKPVLVPAEEYFRAAVSAAMSLKRGGVPLGAIGSATTAVRIVEPVTVIVGVERLWGSGGGGGSGAPAADPPAWPDEGDETWGAELVEPPMEHQYHPPLRAIARGETTVFVDLAATARPLPAAPTDVSQPLSMQPPPLHVNCQLMSDAFSESSSGSPSVTGLRSGDASPKADWGICPKSPSESSSNGRKSGKLSAMSLANIAKAPLDSPLMLSLYSTGLPATALALPQSPAVAQKKVFAFESFGVAAFKHLAPDTTYRISVNAKDSQGRWSGRHSIVSSTLDASTVLVDAQLKGSAKRSASPTHPGGGSAGGDASTTQQPTPVINVPFHMLQQALPLAKGGGAENSLAAVPVEYDVVIVGTRARELEVRATMKPSTVTHIGLNARIESLGFTDAVIEWEGAWEGPPPLPLPTGGTGAAAPGGTLSATPDPRDQIQRFSDEVAVREYRMHIAWEFIVDANNVPSANAATAASGTPSPERRRLSSPPASPFGGMAKCWASAASAAMSAATDDFGSPPGSPLSRRSSLRRRSSFSLADMGSRRRATSVVAASETLTAERRFKDLYFRAATRRTRIDNLDRDKIYTVSISVFDPLHNRWSTFSKPLTVTTASLLKLRMTSVLPTGVFLEWRKDETVSEQLLLRQCKLLAPTLVEQYEVTALRVNRTQEGGGGGGGGASTAGEQPPLSLAPSFALTDLAMSAGVFGPPPPGQPLSVVTSPLPPTSIPIISQEIVKPPASTYVFRNIETGIISLTIRPTYAYGSKGPESPPLLVRIVPVTLQIVSMHERSIVLRIAFMPMKACERAKSRQGRIMLSLVEVPKQPRASSSSTVAPSVDPLLKALRRQTIVSMQRNAHGGGGSAGSETSTHNAEVSLDAELFEFKGLPTGTVFTASAFAAADIVECSCCPEPPNCRGTAGGIAPVSCSTLLSIAPVILRVGESTVEVEFERNCRGSIAEKYTINLWDMQYQQRLDAYATPAKSLLAPTMTKTIRGLMPGCQYEVSVRPATEPPETFYTRQSVCVPFATAGPLTIALVGSRSAIRVFRCQEAPSPRPAAAAAAFTQPVASKPQLSEALLRAPVQLRIEQQPKVPPRVGLAGVRAMPTATNTAPTTAAAAASSGGTTPPPKSALLLGDESAVIDQSLALKSSNAPSPVPGAPLSDVNGALYSAQHVFSSLGDGREVPLPAALPAGATLLVWARQRTEDKLWGAWEKAAFKLV